jgi:hypothetical protein
MNLAKDDLSAERYLLIADVSGYTSFLHGVERAHLVDLSGVMPAGYEIIGELLTVVIDGVKPVFRIEQIEGDAVFGTADAGELDGQGTSLLGILQATYDRFREVRDDRARSATDHVCTACPVVGTLDLKYVLHRGRAVRIQTGGNADLHGPAVIAVHRLLKNAVQARIGTRPYVFVTDEAGRSLGVSGTGLPHEETYSDVGTLAGEIFELPRVPGSPTA